jgi:hypothetical protein
VIDVEPLRLETCRKAFGKGFEFLNAFGRGLDDPFTLVNGIVERALLRAGEREGHAFSIPGRGRCDRVKVGCRFVKEPVDVTARLVVGRQGAAGTESECESDGGSDGRSVPLHRDLLSGSL